MSLVDLVRQASPTGPLIGWHLAQLVVGGNLRLDPADYPVEQYVKK